MRKRLKRFATSNVHAITDLSVLVGWLKSPRLRSRSKAINLSLYGIHKYQLRHMVSINMVWTPPILYRQWAIPLPETRPARFHIKYGDPFRLPHRTV